MKRLLMVLAVLSLGAQADEAARQQPASLRADRIEIDQRTGISRYQGRVVVSQGTLRLTADRATVTRQGELLRNIAAEGHPATFRDRPEGQTELIEGQALRLEYEALERKLHLVGAVLITRGEDRLEAGELHYHLNTESVSARSRDGQRVRAALVPQKQAASEETP